MKYCIDASALIDLGERHYPEHLPVFSPIWEFLYEGIESGTIISVDYVRIELEREAGDWRQQFLSRADGMFKISEDIEQEFAAVVAEIESRDEFRINKQRERFLSGGDPWLIALANSVNGCTVVSSETKSLTDYGLGAVCSALGVEHANLVQIFEKNSVGR